MAGSNKSLRLLFPQWQGGNNPIYHFGSTLLNYLAPPPKGPVEIVNVESPEERRNHEIEDGIYAKTQLIKQHSNASALIKKHNPDNLVIIGGDCSVDLVPFSYLLEKYEDLAILWVDAHPDISNASQYQNSHAHVLGNLMGTGDKDLVDFVSRPITPERIMYAGLQKTLDYETEFIQKYSLKYVDDKALVQNSDEVITWLKDIGAKHVAIHLDLDVLDPILFKSLLPCTNINPLTGVVFGKMKLEEVCRLLVDVSKVTEIVGLGIAEHTPYDSYNLKSLLAALPLIGDPEKHIFKEI